MLSEIAFRQAAWLFCLVVTLLAAGVFTWEVGHKRLQGLVTSE